MGWLFEVVEGDENGDLEGNGPGIKKVVSAVGRSQWVERRFECGRVLENKSTLDVRTGKRG